MQVVDPHQRVETLHFRHIPLLPVHPPEVDADIFHGVVDQLKIIAHEALIGDAEGDILLAGRVDAHLPGELGVDVFEVLHALGRVQVEGHFQALLVQPIQQGRRVGDQLAVPGITRPGDGRVPVHVDDKDVQRQVVLLETVDDVLHVLGGISPIARPPGAQHEARDQRDAAAEAHVFGQGAGVIVAVAEEIPVLLGVFALRRHPAVFRVEEHRATVVEQSPAGARQDALFEGRVALAAIYRAACAAQVVQAGHSRLPGHRLAVQGKRDAQIVGHELAAVSHGCA